MPRPDNKSGAKGGWLFLGVMLVIYAITALLDPSLARQAILFFSQVLGNIVPVLVLVFILILLSNLFMTPARVKSWLGKSAGIKGWLFAMLGGVLATGPIYAWYVLLAELGKKGMQTSLMAVFLYARAVKLPLLPLLAHYFGFSYTLVLSFYLIAFSVLSGVLTQWLVGNHAYTDDKSVKP